MKINSNKVQKIVVLISSIVFFVLPLLFFVWLFKSPYFSVVDDWIKTNKTIYITSLLIYKTIGVLYPPIPAGILTMASVPFLGWVTAYLVDFVGSLMGGVIAYYLGRKYGLKLLKFVLGEKVANKVSTIKVKKDKEIEAIFVYRLAFGSTILEAIYYGAGLLQIGLKNFIIGSALSHMVLGIPSFYFINSVFSGGNIYITVILTIIGVVIVYLTKSRYIE